MKNCIWISPKGSGVSHNRLYYFKKTFNLDKIDEGVVEISAQSRYKLYINGVFCAFGPCKGTREQVYFDTVNVKDYLKVGENEILVKVIQLYGRDSDGGIIPADGVLRTGICALCLELTCGDTVIKADELEYSTITKALLNGVFYASEGPQINDVWYEDGKIHTVYGINLYVGNALIKEIPDIFFRPESANEFIFLCNKLKLTEEKLLYLIDFILGRIV